MSDVDYTATAFMDAARGLPLIDTRKVMEKHTRGVNWVGSTKTDMADCYEGTTVGWSWHDRDSVLADLRSARQGLAARKAATKRKASATAARKQEELRQESFREGYKQGHREAQQSIREGAVWALAYVAAKEDEKKSANFGTEGWYSTAVAVADSTVAEMAEDDLQLHLK